MEGYQCSTYGRNHCISIDLIPIYVSTMMAFVQSELLKNENSFLIIEDVKDYKDPNYKNLDTFYEHIFGKLQSAIVHNGEGRHLIRVYIDLSNLKGKYPRVITSIS
eukprot:307090_1